MIPLSELTEKGLDALFKTYTKDDIPELEQRLENVKAEFKEKHGYIDVESDEEILALIDTITELKK